MTQIGYEIGLVDDLRYEKSIQKKKMIQQEIERLRSIKVNPTEEVNVQIQMLGSSPLNTVFTLEDLLKRPELNYEKLAVFDTERPELPKEIIEQVQIEIVFRVYKEADAAS